MPYYRCASCPPGFKMNHNATFCEDIDECDLHNPCDPMTKCVNLAPGFRCEPCPNGFDGIHVEGYYAQTITQEYTNQICNDIDECALGLANCGFNALCVNTMGSFTCECNKGYVLGIKSGCNAIPGLCPDGMLCDKNAVCKHSEGSGVCCPHSFDTKCLCQSQCIKISILFIILPFSFIVCAGLVSVVTVYYVHRIVI